MSDHCDGCNKPVPEWPTGWTFPDDDDSLAYCPDCKVMARVHVIIRGHVDADPDSNDWPEDGVLYSAVGVLVSGEVEAALTPEEYQKVALILLTKRLRELSPKDSDRFRKVYETKGAKGAIDFLRTLPAP